MTANPRSPRAIVIGGGLAGLCAALRAAERGVDSTVLEAGTDAAYLCNTRLAMGFFNVAFRDIGEPPAVLRETIDRVTENAAEPALADVLAREASPALRWLRGQGVRTIVGNWRVGSAAMLAPPAAIGAGLRWAGRGADRMLRCLEGRLHGAGGQLRRGVTVRELIVRNGRCSGVTAEENGRTIELESAATVIADGGFQANLELLARYVSPAPESLVMRNAGTGRGAGLLMAVAAGAATTALGGFYGHVQCADAKTNPKLWPYPTCDHLVGAGIAVDATGARFADEGLGGVYVANRIAALSQPTHAFAVFDNRAWRERATAFPLPANPLLIQAGATVHRADDLAGLACAAGLPGERLQHTVATYNAALAAGAAGKLAPPRSATVFAPLPVVAAPFYAVKILAGITYTTGGIAIDEWCRVRASGGGTIAGLYAAGSATGGHEGGPAAGYTGGLSKALVFGRRAGDTLADDLTPARIAS